MTTPDQGNFPTECLVNSSLYPELAEEITLTEARIIIICGTENKTLGSTLESQLETALANAKNFGGHENHELTTETERAYYLRSYKLTPGNLKPDSPITNSIIYARQQIIRGKGITGTDLTTRNLD